MGPGVRRDDGWMRFSNSPQMLAEEIRGAAPGEFGGLAVVNRLSLLVDKGVLGLVAEQFDRLAGGLHAFFEGIDNLRRAPVVLAGEMRLQRDFDVRRLGRLLRRNAVEYHARGQLRNPGCTDDGHGP